MTDRIRVLQVLPSLVEGGAERMAAHLAVHLDKSQFEVKMVSLYDPMGSDLGGILEAAGIPVAYLGKKSGFASGAYPRLYREIAAFSPHVVHSHLNALLYAAPAARAAGTPLHVYTAHNLLALLIPQKLEWFYGFCFRNWVTPVSIAEAVSADLAKRYGGLELPMIPNGIPLGDHARPASVREQWRRSEGFGADQLLLACVARLTPQKNHALLLEAIALAPGVELLLAGDGPLRGELQAQAQRLGIAARVHFLGIRHDIPDLLAASDAFVLSSTVEANPLAVMEAMAAGLPVICTAVGGIRELVAGGEHGWLVEPGDAAGLAAAIRAAASDAQHRRLMGARGRQRALSHFDVAVMTAAYQLLYLERLRARPVPFRSTPEKLQCKPS
jgi:glycosyltransferase involved in cell wall biosynthesis